MRLETHSEVHIVLMEFLLFEIWNKTNIKEKILKKNIMVSLCDWKPTL